MKTIAVPIRTIGKYKGFYRDAITYGGIYHLEITKESYFPQTIKVNVEGKATEYYTGLEHFLEVWELEPEALLMVRYFIFDERTHNVFEIDHARFGKQRITVRKDFEPEELFEKPYEPLDDYLSDWDDF